MSAPAPAPWRTAACFTSVSSPRVTAGRRRKPGAPPPAPTAFLTPPPSIASVADAVADLHHVFATCPRPRHIVKPVLTARGAAAELRAITARDLRAGLLFGPERAGLDNDDMAAADALIRYPLNPAFMSLNLAQAVMVMAYEWWTAADTTPPRTLMTNESQVATKGRLDNFLTHLIDQLDACGFLRNLPKRPGMVRNLQHFFQRGEVTEQELRTLHGVVTELAIGRRQRGRLEEPDPG